jgi:hypothetical protein
MRMERFREERLKVHERICSLPLENVSGKFGFCVLIRYKNDFYRKNILRSCMNVGQVSLR